MAIFGNLKLENIVQVGDKTRLNAVDSFVSKDEAAITLIEVEPFSGLGFVDITAANSRDWFLDWQYEAAQAGTVTVSLRITTDGAPVTSTFDLTVLTAAEDNLYSADSDLTASESDILRFLPEGRNSFLNVHRDAQSIILAELDESGITNRDGSRLTKDQIVDVEEVNKWSRYLVLWLIMSDNSNAVDDIFNQKAMMYKDRANFHKERAFIRLDLNKDGDATPGEYQPIRSPYMDRR